MLSLFGYAVRASEIRYLHLFSLHSFPISQSRSFIQSRIVCHSSFHIFFFFIFAFMIWFISTYLDREGCDLNLLLVLSLPFPVIMKIKFTIDMYDCVIIWKFMMLSIDVFFGCGSNEFKKRWWCGDGEL